jgi:tRNA (guanine-N7-)-methyltransferase
MRRRIRHHVNPLSAHHLDTGAGRLALPAGRPVEVELGCAEGEFLFARACVVPDRWVVGVEIREALVTRINARAATEQAPVQAVYANLMSDLETLFAPGAVALCHVNFPDPCFKRSQHKRRFFTPELAGSIARVLAPEGLVSVQTDIWDLGLEALEILETSADFVNALGPWTFARENVFGARTRRERRCQERGTVIWRLRFERAPSRPLTG